MNIEIININYWLNDPIFTNCHATLYKQKNSFSFFIFFFSIIAVVLHFRNSVSCSKAISSSLNWMSGFSRSFLSKRS